MPVISDYIFQSLTGLRQTFCRFSLTKVTGSLNEVSQIAQEQAMKTTSYQLTTTRELLVSAMAQKIWHLDRDLKPDCFTEQTIEIQKHAFPLEHVLRRGASVCVLH